MIKHFGVEVRTGKKGLRINRDKYSEINSRNSFNFKFESMQGNYADDEGIIYTEEWCIKHQRNILKNYDLSMSYFSLLDKNEFDNEISKFIKKYKKFKEVEDLNFYKDKSGYYIMILDEFKQIYVGTTNDIKKRIRQHWTRSKQFDRLLFPMSAVETSIMSIDSFRAMDTTRILVYCTEKTFDKEDEYMNFFSPKFLCNRISGGRVELSMLSSNFVKIKTLK
jgi:hypothetical protein